MQNLKLGGCEQTPAFHGGLEGGGAGSGGGGALPRQGLVRQTEGRTLFLVGLEPSPLHLSGLIQEQVQISSKQRCRPDVLTLSPPICSALWGQGSRPVGVGGPEARPARKVSEPWILDLKPLCRDSGPHSCRPAGSSPASEGTWAAPAQSLCKLTHTRASGARAPVRDPAAPPLLGFSSEQCGQGALWRPHPGDCASPGRVGGCQWVGSLALHKETRAPPGAGDKGLRPAPPPAALGGGSWGGCLRAPPSPRASAPTPTVGGGEGQGLGTARPGRERGGV